MSYLVLARKYRPQTFDDVVGQKPVVKTLKNSLVQNRVSHALLFSGVRGVGKTTLARIMAKAINCIGETESKPCNECRSCKEITQGQSLDLHEIDGASNRGIQEIRELKEKIRFLPTTSKYKIIIIDEVHMLTTEAFNGLLKTLEEPPEHVHFMFATTELHKIPVTILSRCQRYELKRVTSDELNQHFSRIAQEEKVEIEPDALSMIVREAEGSVRDGLSLLDQMFSFGGSHISLDDTIQVLGLTDRNILINISKALLSGDRITALQTLDGAFDYGIDLKRFLSDLLECLRTLMLLKVGSCNELIDLPGDEIDLFQKTADKYSFETIHMKLGLLMKAAEEIRYTTQPRLALETSFLKIIESGNVVPVSNLLDKVQTLLNREDSDPSSHQIGEVEKKKDVSQPETIVNKVKDKEEPLPQSQPQSQPVAPKSEIPKKITQTKEPTASSTVPQQISQEKSKPIIQEEPPLPEEQSPQAVDVEIHPHTHDVRRDWLKFTEYVKDRKIWMAQDLQRAISSKEIDGELHLQYSDPATCALLRSKENKKLLTEFVLDFFQKDLTVRFILPGKESGGNGGDDTESPHKLRQQLIRDPLVQMTVEIFNGQIGDVRIGPRSR